MIKKITKKRGVIAVTALILSAVLLLILQPYLASKINEQGEVLRAKVKIVQGSKITTDMIETVKIGTYNMPKNLFSKAEEVVGRYATNTIFVGDFFTPEKLQIEQPGNAPYLTQLGEEEGAISVSLKEVATGLAGKLQANDIIRIIATGEETVSVESLQYVKVLSVSDEDGKDKAPVEETTEEEKLIKMVTLLVNDRQARDLTYYKENKTIYFMLMHRGEKEKAEELLAGQKEILKTLAEQEEKEKAEKEALEENKAPAEETTEEGGQQ